FRERLAETRVILQSRQEAPSEHTSIDLAADVPASLPVLQVEADTRQLSRAVVEKHERAASAGTPGRRPDEIVIPLRQAGGQGLAPRVVDRQAISLTADVGPGVALEHRHGGSACPQGVRETQPAQSSSDNDCVRSSHSPASESLNALTGVVRSNVLTAIFD